MQSFAHGRLFVGIQSIQFFKQCQALAFDTSRHIQRSLLLFVHLPLFSVSSGCRGGDPEQVVIVRRCGRWYYNCTSCPVSLGRIRGLMLNRTKTHVRREKPSKKSTNGRWCPFCANLRLKRHRFEGVFQCPLYFDLSDKKLLTCETVRLSVKPLSWHSISTDK